MEESVEDIKKSIFRDLPLKSSSSKKLPSYDEMDKVKQLELENKKYKLEIDELTKRIKELFSENHRLREELSESGRSMSKAVLQKGATWKDKLGLS
ncbi:MAG: hypothetical protein ABH829_05030 [archaeon]